MDEKEKIITHIAIEGGLGVGKTTLARGLANKLEGDLLLENSDDNPFIGLFEQNPERHGLSVRLASLFSRLKQWQMLHAQDTDAAVVVSDYLFAKDRLFALANLSEAELTLYDQVAALLAINVPQPDLVVYLQSSPEVAMQRMKQSNHSVAHEVDLDYIKKINTTYDDFFFHYKTTPLLVVQTDRINFADHPAALDMLIQRVNNMRSGTEFWSDYSE